MILWAIPSLLISCLSFSATIAIIDTGFDLDHEYLKPKLLQVDPPLTEKGGAYSQYFFDNNHLKKRAIEDKSLVQDILLYRTLKAKGHKGGLTLEEFEWFNLKSADKAFMEKVRLFKKHSHGTIVAGIALREGENINIFPIRGLNIPHPVVAIEAHTDEALKPLVSKNPEEKFQEEIKQSLDRVSKKFSKICQLIALKKIEIVNASYGITFKSILLKFRERYKEITGQEIEETRLKILVDNYFQELYLRGEKTLKKYPETLFVFSAGNSGIDNDLYHHYPSKIKVDNAIAVGAMNGEYLATFSNFGQKHVDIGAPGVAILSLVPRVYADDGTDLFSPASGTSMAAPYVANLGAQIKNTNPKLTPLEIKKIIMETADKKDYLQTRLSSGGVVNNEKALKASVLSKDFPLSEAIRLATSGLVTIEDKISTNLSPVVTPEEIQTKVMNTIPAVITTQEVDDVEEGSAPPPTK